MCAVLFNHVPDQISYLCGVQGCKFDFFLPAKIEKEQVKKKTGGKEKKCSFEQG
jgi:hypothetical protein